MLSPMQTPKRVSIVAEYHLNSSGAPAKWPFRRESLHTWVIDVVNGQAIQMICQMEENRLSDPDLRVLSRAGGQCDWR